MRTRRLAVLVAAGTAIAALSGCAKYSKSHFTVGSVPDDYRTRHPIKIEESEQTLDIPVASAAYKLGIPTESAIQGFARGFKKSANGSIRIMTPSGSPNEQAANGMAHRVADALRRSGVEDHRIIRTTYFAGEHGASAPIRLSYNSIQPKVTGCGKWNEDLSETSENKQYHNFGCASQNNLAAMVANPSDLLGPRGMTETDAVRRSKVIKDYREGIQTNSSDNVNSIVPVFRDG